MNDPRQPQSVPPIPQRPVPVQPLRPVQHAPPGSPVAPRIPQAPHAPHAPQGQPAMRTPPPAAGMPAARPVHAMPGRPAPAPINPHAGDTPLDLDPIEMDDEPDEDSLEPAPTRNKITFGADGHLKKHAYTRQTTMTGQGACRVRTFHGKLSDQGLEYLDDAINTFLDEHPEIEIKFVTSNVGMFDGKFKDIAMIVNVWY